ncbi:hypothetical protein GQ457_15G006150 [Hibiscus cannabinus]
MEMEIPVGFRFLPTDKELVIHYLINKVIYNPLSLSFFREINATEFYGKPPKSLVQFSDGEREWFFFMYKDGDFDKIEDKANQLEFWKSTHEDLILDKNENVLATKTHFNYFSNSKKTHWRMEEYQLPLQFYTQHNSKENWAVGRLTRGTDYTLVYF